MMSIGEFAQLTGLSVKALRLYGERGLLEPASVDSSSGYRRYAAGQLATAIRLKALRAAGVSLADAAQALDDPQRASAVLAKHRANLVSERDRQDAALAAAEALLADDDREWHIEERQATAAHWAGVALSVRDDGDDDDDTERADAAFTALWNALAADDNAPTGPFWSMFRASDDEDSVDLLCCWPIARPVPDAWSAAGLDVVAGHVPAGSELVARWRHDEPMPAIEGAAHPAVLALLVVAEEAGTDLDVSRLRQIGLIEDGQLVGVEVAVPLTG